MYTVTEIRHGEAIRAVRTETKQQAEDVADAMAHVPLIEQLTGAWRVEIKEG